MKSRKYLRKPAHESAISGHFGRLNVLSTKMVFPGESMTSHSVKARVYSVPTEGNIGGAYVDLFTFYVPLRLIWSDFQDWCVDPASGVSPGTLGADDPEVLSKSGDLDWAQSARDLIYSEFFEHDGLPAAANNLWLPFPTISGTEEGIGADSDETVSVDVSTPGSEHFNLSDMDYARYKARFADFLEGVGDSYPAMLKSFGVNVADMQITPEYLGGSRRFIYPSRSVNETTGYSVQNYVGDFSFKRNRKRAYFSEHGILIDFMAIRPKLYATNAGSRMASMAWRHMLAGPSQIVAETDTIAHLDYLYTGERLVGSDAVSGTYKPCYTYAPATAVDKVYPNWGAIVGTTDIGGNDHYLVDCRSSSSFRTWIKPPRLMKQAPSLS